jgi:hypothetical protein
MPPPAVTPEQIEEYAPRMPARILKVDANVAAYFGDFFHALRAGLTKAPRKGEIEKKLDKRPIGGLLPKAPDADKRPIGGLLRPAQTDP